MKSRKQKRNQTKIQHAHRGFGIHSGTESQSQKAGRAILPLPDFAAHSNRANPEGRERPIARFDGFGCYQSKSETGDGRKLGLHWAFRRLVCEGKTGDKPRRRSGEVAGLVQSLFTGAKSPDLLQKQEQKKGPQNAPIARFDGLGCYQTSSEMGDACGAFGACRRPRKRGRALGGGLAATDGAVWAVGWLSRQEMRRVCAQAAKVQQGKPGLTRFALFSGANKRPRKRLHRTV